METGMETEKEISQAEKIIEGYEENQASLIIDLVRKKFREDDFTVLAKLNTLHENGFLTDQEYVTRITSILHEIWIEEHNHR